MPRVQNPGNCDIMDFKLINLRSWQETMSLAGTESVRNGDAEYILVVDDDAAMLHTVRLLLEGEGYQVDTAGDGVAAISRIEQATAAGCPYSLLVIDLKLDGMNGLEIARRARAICEHIQSVIITGHPDLESAITALRDGVLDYLLKPYQLEQLKMTVQRALAVRRRAKRTAALLAQSERRASELATLNRVGQTVTRSLQLDQVLNLILEQIRGALQAEAASIALVEQDKLVFKVAAGPSAEQVKRFALDLGQGLVGWCVQEGKPVLVPDARVDPRHFGEVDARTAFVTRTVVCVPMVAEGRTIGAIEAINRQDGRAFDGSDLELLQAMSIPASVAVENAKLHANLAQKADELEKALAELKELDRLKSQFVQNVSHELRTPLTYIRGYIELLQAESMGPVTTEQMDSLNLIAKQSDLLTQLVNDIILMQEGAIETAQEEISLKDIVLQAVAQARASYSRPDLTIREELPGTPCLVRGDQAQLNRVIVSLLDNAVKFSPNGGEIVVNLAGRDDRWELQISDTGIGIPADKLDKIFSRFYQVDGSTTRRFRGTGLGLSVAKEIVQAHGGQIWVRSTEGVGSTFGICLPKAS